ncbi:FeoA family protein [Methanosphaera sp. WGK6]|uniref:FeoA family protein n=1 Tax=Methanosphaera sp. WGK6 TaxID=1561964 RepID=UPI00084BFE17|nr:FeoA family protein [Methanosphaera sp. WGK6]OED29560.1 iron transporter FeoA [Methanosphaera sp. WGK6]
MTRTADDLNLGETGIIKKHKVKGSLGKHLREMGLVSGTPIKFQRKAPLGYPVEVKIQGFSLALRKEELKSIEIEDE